MKKNVTHFLKSALLSVCAVVSLLLAGTQSGYAQPGAMMQLQEVTGVVVDQQGNPIIGATVELKDSFGAVAVATDLEGRFTLNAPKSGILVFSYVGYMTHEVEIAGRTNITVSMVEDTQTLEDVVVVGYGVQKRSSLTGSISQVKAEDMEARTITTASQALQGKTSGVQVLSGSARPGASPSIRIRGIGSNSSTEPLYVVDGRIASGIAGIDPNDIESMEVLKDGASAAIYGAQAGNGVILITTKKGKGSGRITYDYQRTVQSLAYVPHVMNSEQYIDYYTEAGAWTLADFYNNWDFKTNTDWIRAATENSVMERHNVTFSAGDFGKSLYISGSYLNNDGIVSGGKDFYERLTGMINASWKIKPWLEIGTNNQIEYYASSSVAEGSEYGGYILALLTLDPLTKPWYSVEDMPRHMKDTYYDSSLPPMLTDKDGNVYSSSYFNAGENRNPFIQRDSSSSLAQGFNINGTTYLNFMPMKDLTFTSRISYVLSAGESYGVNHDYTDNRKYFNQYLSVNASASVNSYYQWENFLNYQKSIGDHHMSAMLGMSYSQSRSFGVNGSVAGVEGDLGFQKDDPLFHYFAYKTPGADDNVGGGEAGYSRKNSYFGRLSYEYAGKYLLQASLRADAADSSVLPIATRWGYFPAASAGWVVSQEEFMQDTQDWLSHLKLRASWGQNGSIAGLGGYRYDVVITSAGTYPTGNVLPNGNWEYITSYMPSAAGNPELKWETAEQTNIGVDARFFGDRLSVSADWFVKNTKDLIVPGIKPSTVMGATASPMNVGNIMNRGIELELGWQDNIGNFHYGIRGNISTIENKVTEIHETLNALDGQTFHTYGAITRFETGRPAWYLYGYEFAGIDPNTGNPTFVDQLTEDSDGDGVFDMGDGTIDDKDKTMIGNPMADITYGLTFNAAWKGFDVIVFGTGAIGNDIYACLNRSDYNLNKLTYYTENRWTETNKTGTTPKAGASEMDKYYLSSANVFDGSYFKIKQIQVGYTFPKHLTKRLNVENLRIYASLDDYFTFTDYIGFDPEITNGGVDKGTYPTSRKVVAGLSLAF